MTGTEALCDVAGSAPTSTAHDTYLRRITAAPERANVAPPPFGAAAALQTHRAIGALVIRSQRRVMASPQPPSAAIAPLQVALRLTRRFAALFYALLALLLAGLSAVPPLLSLHLSASARHYVVLVTTFVALPLLAAALWRRRVVLRRLSAVEHALHDGALLERPTEGVTRLAALDDGAASAPLPQLSDILKSLSHSVPAPSATTPLLSDVDASLQAALLSLSTHPVLRLQALLSRLFRTAGVIAFLHPLLTSALAGAAWFLSLRKGSIALNVLGAVSGAGSQLATWAVRRRVFHLVADAVERLVDEELDRRKSEMGAFLMDGTMKLGDDMLRNPVPYDISLTPE